MLKGYLCIDTHMLLTNDCSRKHSHMCNVLPLHQKDPLLYNPKLNTFVVQAP